MTAHENWLSHEEKIQLKGQSLRTKRTQIKLEIDRLRTINPYYPVNDLSGKLASISKELKRIDNGEDVL